MRFFNLFFLATMALSIVSCSSDDDNNEETSANLVGSWRATEFTYEGSTTTEFQGSTEVSEFEGQGEDLDFSVTFSSNPNEVSVSGSYELVLTFTSNGQTNTEIQTITVSENGSWEREGNTLEITTNGETVEASITELTNTKLTYVSTTTQVEESNGVTTTIEATETATFERQ